LAKTNASACLISNDLLEHIPAHVAALVVTDPERAFAIIGGILCQANFTASSSREHAYIDPTAKLEPAVSVGAGAVIGAHVEIGENTIVGANAVIESGVTIGRDCRIGPNASIKFAHVGNRVTVQPNAVIGGDGFGYAMGPEGHLPIPQLGRVIIQDNVDIGSGTTIDRGAADDTIIGEGTKIDNLAQIGHNCVIGRHCIIAGTVGLAGSTILEDFVVMGGNSGTAGHLTIGSGSQVAGKSGVTKDLPPGGIYAGFPAKPVSEWRREVASLARLARRKLK
jgi:UDP-3-O-[3-hydroxymyristoyl] glucosamine N-acyltransferase